MSIMCYVAGLSPSQITAFRDHPRLASDFATASVSDLLDARVQHQLARLSPDVRQVYEQQYDQAKQFMIAKSPSIREQKSTQDADRSLLARLGPFQPVLELGQSWHILHYLMTGHADVAEIPGNTLLTGASLGDDVGYGPPRLHGPSETIAFRDFLAQLFAERMIARLDYPRLAQLRVYPLSKVPSEAEAQSWRDEIAASFERLKSYMQRTAELEYGILIWLQ